MYFDQNAQSWDSEPRIKRANSAANEIKKAVPLKKTWSGLEFGSGTGLISFNLANELNKITMIDTSQKMIEVSQNKLKNSELNNIRALNVGIETLIENNEKFDFIYSSMVLHHVVDTNDIIEKFKKALFPEGILCIIDLNCVDPKFHKNTTGFDGHDGFKQEDLKEILKANGFDRIESYTFYNDVKVTDGVDIKYSLFIMISKRESDFS